MPEKMSRTRAIKQAREEVMINRQGDQWIVLTWDERAHAYRESYARPYPAARAAAADETVYRALVKLGMLPALADRACDYERGRVEARVRRFLERYPV